ncbi:MAG: DUF6600 domain-containing protein [Thermoanaerobaculum sp.]
MRTRTFWTLGIAGLVAISLAAWGQESPQDLTSLSYISYLERYATVRAAAQDETLDAVVNMPVLPGDRVETARGARMEVQLADGSTVWLDQFSTLDFDSMTNSRGSTAPRTALYLAAGRVAIEVAPTAPSMRVDSPAGTVYLARGGLYLLALDGDQLQVVAHRGSAELPAGMGSVLLRAGFAAWVANNEEVQRAEWRDGADDFWQWVMERRLPPPESKSAGYVQGAPRAYTLDAYGEWVYVADLGTWGWRPRVSITWVPYSYGRWYWTPAGWCWVSYEPWGWYPYHYGSWYFSVSFGWVWFWDPIWAPAWVHWVYTPGYVGWCPRGYYDWWWWHEYRDPYYRPHRWNEVTFDFSGRVRLGRIDHRPWTFVPEDRFTSSHIERVRLDSERVIRAIGDREGVVRSGPLVTPVPRGSAGAPVLRDVFRDEPPREVTPFLRREPVPRARGGLPEPVRTREAVRALPPGAAPEARRGRDERPLPSRERGEEAQPGGGEPRRSPWRDPEGLRVPASRPSEGEPAVRLPSSRPPSSWQPRAREDQDLGRPSDTFRRRVLTEPSDSPELHRVPAPGRGAAPQGSPWPRGEREPRQVVRSSPGNRELPGLSPPRERGVSPPQAPSPRAPEVESSPRTQSAPRGTSGGSGTSVRESAPRSSGGAPPSRPSHDRPRH